MLETLGALADVMDTKSLVWRTSQRVRDIKHAGDIKQ